MTRGSRLFTQNKMWEPAGSFLKKKLSGFFKKLLINFVRNLSNILRINKHLWTALSVLRMGPTFVTAHTFCASRDTGFPVGGAY